MIEQDFEVYIPPGFDEVAPQNHGGDELLRFKGYIEQIIFHTDDYSYVVVVFSTENDSFTAKGFIPSPVELLSYEIVGKWEEHKKYGKQFEIHYASAIIPETLDGVKEFLYSGIIKGIKEKTADLLIEKFGVEVLSVIENEPERLLEIRGIGQTRLDAILSSYYQNIHIRDSLVFFSEVGIGSTLGMSILKALGGNAVRQIKEDPYVLMHHVRGIGFKRADEVARRLGVPEDADIRVRAAVAYILQGELSSGNTYLLRSEVCAKADAMGVGTESADASIFELVNQGSLVMPYGERVALASVDYTELAVARMLYELLQEARPLVGAIGLVEAFEQRNGIKFDSLQREAIELANAKGVYVITGGPGTGKTTIINCIIHLFEAEKKTVVLCAPTGRAAKKMQEATNRRAMTIHRTLGFDGKEYKVNESNPLEADVVIVDEVSMIDVFLMYRLLAAIKKGTSLILVGDKDQLPSVGAGAVLRDIIASGVVDVVKLQRLFRQSEGSRIALNAHAINHGEMPVNGEDFYFIENTKTTADEVLDIVARRLPNAYDMDPMRDIQCLSVMYRGPSGVDQLNKRLQNLLNPLEKLGLRPAEKTIKLGDREFRLGDKVMQTSNNYDIEWKTEDGGEGSGVYNGDIGFITKISKDAQCLEVTFDDERQAVYNFDEVADLRLAYAITVHKSQGSEYPCIVMPIFSAWSMESRNILYTAITRAKRLVVLVGSRSVLRRFVENVMVDSRHSTLAEKLVAIAHGYSVDEAIRWLKGSEQVDIADSEGDVILGEDGHPENFEDVDQLFAAFIQEFPED